jgi:DNA-binding CsgD family transcriptional regulator
VALARALALPTLRALVADLDGAEAPERAAALLERAANWLLSSGAVSARDASALLALQRAERAVAEESGRRLLAGLRGIQAALAQLHEAGSTGQLFELATDALCRHGDFDRAMLFGVEEGALVARSVYVQDDPAWAASILAIGAGRGRVPLVEPLLERELLRRRAPGLVSDPQNDPRATRALVLATRTRAYVAAPIMPTGRVIGFIHADRYYDPRNVDEVDRDVLWAFAEGLGYAAERTLLREHIRRQRVRIERLTGQLGAVAAELGSSALALGPAAADSAAGGGPGTAEDPLPPLHVDQAHRPVGLTRRELEVLDLLTAGHTNAQIAKLLYVSESTAKAHVKHILRKLGASNRAEAAARFARLEGSGRRL